MTTTLSTEDLVRVVRSVFRPREGDRALGVLCDLPDHRLADRPEWAERRAMAAEWTARLREGAVTLGLERVDLLMYRNVARNNADLPGEMYVYSEGDLPDDADDLRVGAISLERALSTYSILLAPTELSATAPLKLLAKHHRFRAATMGGFAPAMIPALKLDWVDIDQRCRELKARLDPAEAARLRLEAGGATHELTLDLRYREATASGGLLTEPGSAGNLPSGETYIVPYEGERPSDPSRSRGTLPLELDGELLLLRIEGNRVREVLGDGPVAARERAEIADEPAYANVAELGIGLLGDYGIRPVGALLLDEKLGPHVAFGRSDHFGGAVGARDFTAPDRVVHVDRVYIPDVQPQVRVRAIDLVMPGAEVLPLVRDGEIVGAGRRGDGG